MSDPIHAPQPEGYPCNDPDFSKPLPGQVTHWTGNPNFVPRRPPVGILADPWSRALLRPCEPRRTLPPIVVCSTPPTVF